MLLGLIVHRRRDADQIVLIGDEAVFTANAQPADVLYHWQVDEGQGFVTTEGNPFYTGATSMALHICAAGAAQRGYIYRCAVDDKGCTATSGTAVLYGYESHRYN